MEASSKKSCSRRCLEILKTCTSISINSPPLAQFCRRQSWTKASSISGAWMEICTHWTRARLVVCLVLAAGLARGQQKTHDREFWRDIAKHHYEVPGGESASVLARELSAMLASPDPELRDDL